MGVKLIGSAVALVGAWAVHHWHARNRKADAGHSNFLDRGQPVQADPGAQPGCGLVQFPAQGI